MRKKARSWFFISFIFLIIVALLGTLLRYMAITHIEGLNYKYILHSHSHVAMLGWLYGAIFLGLMLSYLPQQFNAKKIYHYLYYTAQFLVLGMLFTFAVKGYWWLSITFSSLHILVFYWIIVRFYRDIRKDNQLVKQHRLSLMFHFAGLIFMALSTVGPWSLGFIAAQGLAGSDLYFQSIYFYLHFQYNGLFTFTIIGFLIYLLEKHQLPISLKNGMGIFWLLAISTVPAYSLSLLGFAIPAWLEVVALLSGGAQLIAAGWIYFLLIKHKKVLLHERSAIVRVLFAVTIFSFIIKFVMQFVSGIPGLGDIAFQMRDVVIAYLHLVMLGLMTCGILFFFAREKYIHFTSPFAIGGAIIFLIGFFLNELELFLNGFLIYFQIGHITGHAMLLVYFSAIMCIGLLLFLLSQIRRSF